MVVEDVGIMSEVGMGWGVGATMQQFFGPEVYARVQEVCQRCMLGCRKSVRGVC